MEIAEATLPLRTSLSLRITESKKFSRIQAWWFGFLYWTTRILLITLAAFMTAGNKIPLLSSASAQTYMSVAIVILTGIDTATQAGTKWKTHYRYNDAYESAKSELAGIPIEDAAGLEEFRKKVDFLDASYTKEALA